MKKPLLASSILLSLFIAFTSSSLVSAISEPLPLGDIPYTIIYSFAGAEGNITPTTVTGSDVQAIATLTDITPYMNNHTFAGWSLDDDNTPDYPAGSTISITARETILYATWTSGQPFSSVDDAPIESSNDIALMGTSEITQPLGRSSTSEPEESTVYSFWASLIIATGAIFSIAIVSGAIYYMATANSKI